MLSSGAIALAAAGASPRLRDLGGQWLEPFTPKGPASVLLFVSSDCPISNSYAPEIQRLCHQFQSQGVGCSLFYEDLQLDAAAARKHFDEYGFGGIPAAIDGERTVAKAAGATVTPQAVVVDRQGAVRYRGRIDNFYAALGKPRQRVTVHDLRDALDAVVSRRPVSTPDTHAFGCSIVPADVMRK